MKKELPIQRMTGLLLCCLLLSSAMAQEAGRTTQSINSNWLFHKGDTVGASMAQWQPVSVPHTYNADDVLDDTPGYYRGVAWYKKRLYIPAAWRQKDIYLHFEGAAQIAAVYVNGKQATQHIGSYGAFNCRINDLLLPSEANEVAVKVDNSENEEIPPFSADFTFFGGIYRDVYVSLYNKVHFDAGNYASKGVFITTPMVSEQQASVKVDGVVANSSTAGRKVLVTHTVYDKDGKQVKQIQQALVVAAGQTQAFTQQLPVIERPALWSPENPYLYSLVSVITDAATKELLDEMSNPLAFRWYRFTGDQGFFLNGKPYKIWGASRHQDYKGLANALPDAMHVKDVQLLKNMGANFLRVAHYPQDPAVLEACDRIGLLASVEIPIVNTITETAAFTTNCTEMMREMIRQYFNHPSVIIWAYMNEVLLRPRFEKDKPRQELYYGHITQLAKRLDSTARAEDPARYTMIPCNGNFDIYKSTGLANIPGILGWNLYQGWYSQTIDRFAAFLDQHHRELPQVPVLVTEYGADGDARLHCFNPVRFDKSIEYENYFHQVYLKSIRERPFVSGGMLWCLSDFYSEQRLEASPHMNTKGIMTSDRQPKEVYRYYQSQLLTKPVVKIGSGGWQFRSGIADTGKTYCTQPVDVYTNQGAGVTLSLNGKIIGTQLPVGGIAHFRVPFVQGNNRLEATVAAVGADSKDVADIRFAVVPLHLRDKELPFTELNVSLGDRRFYIDERAGQVWLPEQAYQPGSWGYAGGSVFTIPNSRRQSYGSDKNILGTDDDPVFETQRTGIQGFRLDVPDGKYEISFHFAELLSEKEQAALANNLDTTAVATRQKADRCFDVWINDRKIITALGNDNYLVPETAYSTKTTLQVTGLQGINIRFSAIRGEAILNGLQVRRIY